MSDSVRPHRWKPTRLPHPWDSPGKNNGVGCRFLLQWMKVKREREVTQSCLTLSDPMDCNLSGSSIHGTLQARVLEWGAMAFSEDVRRLYANTTPFYIRDFSIFGFLIQGALLKAISCRYPETTVLCFFTTVSSRFHKNILCLVGAL